MFLDCSVHHGHQEIWIFVTVTGKHGVWCFGDTRIKLWCKTLKICVLWCISCDYWICSDTCYELCIYQTNYILYSNTLLYQLPNFKVYLALDLVAFVETA